MDIILSFLAKPVDKHGITLVHITYPPLVAEVVNRSLKADCTDFTIRPIIVNPISVSCDSRMFYLLREDEPELYELVLVVNLKLSGQSY